jgi:hypothetical protein
MRWPRKLQADVSALFLRYFRFADVYFHLRDENHRS